ncbi:MAG: SPFH domain-containing protein [Myxococcales bacterium]|nr:SPFH domain-containing protein [Myxococcales bacterium]
MSQQVNETTSDGYSGIGAIGVGLLAGAIAFAAFVSATTSAAPLASIAVVIVAALTALTMFAGIYMLEPNAAAIMQLFGRYVGTARTAGLRWRNPFYSLHKISVRVRTLETPTIKVNDVEGNPIEIRTLAVWRVRDTARAVFEVDHFERFMASQAEAALRDVSTKHPYDAHDDNQVSLRGHTEIVAADLAKDMTKRVALAGLELVEARITHLAYAPEIAQAMLQRQQAGAIIAARQRIVEGAVGMVEMALNMLAHRGVVELDSERKAAMVSNLLVVLCGERSTQPIINTGTLNS